jgi:hypothetical protein
MRHSATPNHGFTAGVHPRDMVAGAVISHPESHPPAVEGGTVAELCRHLGEFAHHATNSTTVALSAKLYGLAPACCLAC